MGFPNFCLKALFVLYSYLCFGREMLFVYLKKEFIDAGEPGSRQHKYPQNGRVD